MGQVTVPVNGRSFTITCDDGQEPRIRGLAQYVDAKVAEFVSSIGQIGEARLLLLAALVIADELSDARDVSQQEHNRAADATANDIQGMTKRVEAIAERLATP